MCHIYRKNIYIHTFLENIYKIMCFIATLYVYFRCPESLFVCIFCILTYVNFNEFTYGFHSKIHANHTLFYDKYTFFSSHRSALSTRTWPIWGSSIKYDSIVDYDSRMPSTPLWFCGVPYNRHTTVLRQSVDIDNTSSQWQTNQIAHCALMYIIAIVLPLTPNIQSDQLQLQNMACHDACTHICVAM